MLFPIIWLVLAKRKALVELAPPVPAILTVPMELNNSLEYLTLTRILMIFAVMVIFKDLIIKIMQNTWALFATVKITSTGERLSSCWTS